MGDLNSDGILTPTDAAIALYLAATCGAGTPRQTSTTTVRITSSGTLMILQASGGAIIL